MVNEDDFLKEINKPYIYANAHIVNPKTAQEAIKKAMLVKLHKITSRGDKGLLEAIESLHVKAKRTDG